MKKDTQKVIEFDAIKREKLSVEGCQCGYKAKYLIDERNMIVKCKKCGARVEPFKALLVIADRASNYNEQIKMMQEQMEAIKEYKPRRVTLKKLEKQFNKSSRGDEKLGTKSYPCCPSCKEPFELSEIEDNWLGGIGIQQRLYKRKSKR